MKTAMLLSLLNLAVVTPDLPPPILRMHTPEFGARGPLRICERHLAIDVLADEGIHVLGPVMRVINDDYLFALAAVPSGDRGPLEKSATSSIRVDDQLVASPYIGPAPAESADPWLETGKVRYVVSRGDDAGDAVLVGSSAFKGTESDRSILSRLRFVPSGPSACIRPLTFAAAGYGAGIEEAKLAGFESYGLASAVALYPRLPNSGPGFHCQGGVGFPIEPGETLLRPFRPLGESTSYLTYDGVTITISASRNPMSRADPADVGEHPMSLLHETHLIYYRSRGTGAPYAPPGVREDGSWSVELGKETGSGLEISFPASQKTPVGFQFLERLEFVSDSDPRCQIN